MEHIDVLYVIFDGYVSRGGKGFDANALLEISLADSGSLGTGGVTDMQANFEIDRLPSPSGRIRM
jgi:hypothetical protein